MDASGIARVESEVENLSFLTNSGIKGITGVLGITEFGEIGKAILVGSWIEYQRNFGGLLEGTLFPLLCKRALDHGAKLRISPVGHYTDVTNPTTLVGVKATKSVTVGQNTAVFSAKRIGTGGNKIIVQVLPPVSGLANTVDIRVTVTGFTSGEVDLTQTVAAVPVNPTADQRAALNAKLRLVDLISTVGGLPLGSFVLAGGTQVFADIAATDYIGDSSVHTGLFSLDQYSDIVRVAVPEMALPTLDMAISAYATMRNVMAILRTPLGLNGEEVVDYRESTNINNWRARMFTGGLVVNHPTTLTPVEIPEIGDVLALMTKRDNQAYPWVSESGTKRGKIGDALDVVYNFGTSARQTEAGQIIEQGISPVINDDTFGVVAWGNGTLSKGDDLLKFAEVAEVIMYIIRNVEPLAKVELFEPNDVDTWKAIFRKVNPFMQRIVDNRGIWRFLYQGDQDIENVEDAVVNTQENIDKGKYQFNLFIAPKVNARYIGIKIGVTNSGISFDLATGVETV